MLEQLRQFVPDVGIGLFLALFLSLMIGFEVEERRARQGAFFFGGVRTYPLITLSGFLLTVIGQGNFIPFTAGLLVFGVLLALVYWFKLEKDVTGFTTEVSAIVAYVLGAVVGVKEYWLAVTVAVVIVLLIHMKVWLENLAARMSGAHEVATFAKFLIITAVILPILPQKSFTEYSIKPYQVWLVVAAVSVVSYGSYLLQLKFKGKGSIFLSAVLGGLYSSTMTTVVLARKSKGSKSPRAYAGAVLLATGMMYLRICALILIFNPTLCERVAGPFLTLAFLATGLGAFFVLHPGKGAASAEHAEIGEGKNPLEFNAALLFAVLFIGVMVLSQWAVKKYGTSGLFGLAALLGLTDVDPFILSLTQTAGTGLPLSLAAGAVIIAASSNNLMKGAYAWVFGDRQAGRWSFCLLAAFSVAGVATLLVL